MARVPYLQPEDVPPEYRDLVVRDTSLYMALANSPKALAAFRGLGSFIRHTSRLDTRLRELAILQVGWLTRSPYEWSHHIKLGYDFGVKDADIEGLIADSAGLPSALETKARLVLRTAREITTAMAPSEETHVALRASFNTEELIDLVMTIAFYSAVVRVLATLEIDVEPDYRKYLEKYPFPRV